MATGETSSKKLTIRKYSNRRFYDATRSCHLTIADMHELIRTGHDLTIEDSTTGEDITNQVLTQIILDRDPPKLEMLPSNILHELIRSQQQLIGNVVEQFFRQVLDTQRASQQRWTTFLQNTLGLKNAPGMNPFDWTAMFTGASREGGRASSESVGTASAQPAAGAPESELHELRRKLEELEKRVGAVDSVNHAAGRRRDGKKSSR